MKLLELVKAKWSALPEATRKEVVSFLHTFVATMAVSISTQLQTDMPLTKDALLALAVAASRSALKAAIATVIK